MPSVSSFPFPKLRLIPLKIDCLSRADILRDFHLEWPILYLHWLLQLVVFFQTYFVIIIFQPPQMNLEPLSCQSPSFLKKPRISFNYHSPKHSPAIDLSAVFPNKPPHHSNRKCGQSQVNHTISSIFDKKVFQIEEELDTTIEEETDWTGSRKNKLGISQSVILPEQSQVEPELLAVSKGFTNQFAHKSNLSDCRSLKQSCILKSQEPSKLTVTKLKALLCNGKENHQSLKVTPVSSKPLSFSKNISFSKRQNPLKTPCIKI